MKKLPFRITVAWSEEDQAFEARIPAIRHCLAYGSTAEKAVKEVKTAAEAMLAVLEAKGKPVPHPDIALERLAELQPVLNMSAVARAAGIPVQTLASKLQRGTPLTQEEAEGVAMALEACGVR